MRDAVRDMIATAMSQASDVREHTAFAPSNIALAKYWGKRDQARNLPLNSSLSVSLGTWGSETCVKGSDDGRDRVLLGGTPLEAGSSFARKVLAFADMFRGTADIPLTISTNNTIPTAAGLASSASGFAALTRTLCGAFGLGLSDTDMSRIARLGSGSAARSLWHGFVEWQRGNAEDGSDSHGIPLDLSWPEFRIAIIEVDTAPKLWSSREGMNHTVATSPLFANWPAQADADCQAIKTAVEAQDFATLGPLVEANALMMHATMQSARPAVTYLTGASWGVLTRLQRARADGLEAYATMDAGPNVKLIFLSGAEADVISAFPDAKVISPMRG